MTTAAAVVVAGAAVGAQASSSPSSAHPAGSTAAAGSSSANDPHEAAAQREAERIITTFQAPPGADQDARQPSPLPADLQNPPIRSAAETQATATAWYTTAQSPDEVLAWVRAHPPTGSSWSGSGSGPKGSFVSYQFASLNDQLSITPATGSDGRTVIRLDAAVIWTPSRDPGTLLGYGAPSVSVVTDSLNPQNTLPATETRTLTATAPLVVHQVVDLLNALTPPIPVATRHCAIDDGTLVRITLPGAATVTADPGGCGEVTVTPQSGPAQHYSGGPELVTKVYALFGVIWSRTGDLPQGIERTGASGLQ